MKIVIFGGSVWLHLIVGMKAGCRITKRLPPLLPAGPNLCYRRERTASKAELSEPEIAFPFIAWVFSLDCSSTIAVPRASVIGFCIPSGFVDDRPLRFIATSRGSPFYVVAKLGTGQAIMDSNLNHKNY